MIVNALGQQRVLNLRGRRDDPVTQGFADGRCDIADERAQFHNDSCSMIVAMTRFIPSPLTNLSQDRICGVSCKT